ncbi:MAG TPA: LON peptidase substrate-binding domain-containing protein [Anaerolineales bacterium]|nr:LON peptidase substrate-binding domain-containing protein [Anaerolineales bacterium]HRF49793.1 LON peptidase substrate-binding domain-containing protein [Anaerolineales bacterium]
MTALRLPLFPLNTVLFPGMVLPLHIFEPRYREMVNRCLDEHLPFGVTLIESGPEVGGPAQPHPVGTYGMIQNVERLADGRMNIEVVGQERFRIVSLHHDKSYLCGTLERYPLDAAGTARAVALGHALRPWVQRYLKILGESANVRLDTQSLPDEPTALAYLAAIVAQVPAPEKQALLACPSAVELLARERRLYRREVSLIRALLAHRDDDANPDFCPN